MRARMDKERGGGTRRRCVPRNAYLSIDDDAKTGWMGSRSGHSYIATAEGTVGSLGLTE